ncbi:MAG: signal peptidase I [Bacilli bacterium]
MKEKNIKKELLSYLLIIVGVVLFRLLIATPAIIDGISMENTLSNNDLVIIDKVSYKFDDINRFDIVAVNSKKINKRLVKRIIGLPYETVEFINNELYINGKKIEEEFLIDESITLDFSTSDTENYRIPKDHYFVMGDNRKNSTDSRIIGVIDISEIIGKVSFRLFPFKSFGFVK